MSHNIAGIDVHKKLLVVVIVEAAKPDVILQSRKFGTGAAELGHVSAWLSQYAVEEAVMESTAAILEAGVAGTGATHAPASGAGAVQ